MNFSVSNYHKQIITHPWGSGNHQQFEACIFTYDVKNLADGSIDRVTRQGNKRFFSSDPYSVATISENEERRLQQHSRKELLQNHCPLKDRVRTRATDLEILATTQQQIINSMQNSIAGLNAQIQALSQSAAAKNQSYEALQAQYASLQAQIVNLEATLNTQNAQVAAIPALQAQMAGQKAQIDALKAYLQMVVVILQR